MNGAWAVGRTHGASADASGGVTDCGATGRWKGESIPLARAVAESSTFARMVVAAFGIPRDTRRDLIARCRSGARSRCVGFAWNRQRLLAYASAMPFALAPAP